MAKKPFIIAQIERSGDKLVIPKAISYENAVQLIVRQVKYERERVTVQAAWDVSPWDGALSLSRVLDRLYGALPPSYAEQETLFGKQKINPQAREVASGPNGQTVSVPWGVYEIPMLGSLTAEETGDVPWTARISTDVEVTGNPRTGFSRAKFKIEGEVLRQHEQDFSHMASLVEADLRENSLYRGKAFRLSLFDGETLRIFPEVSFMDVGHLTPNDLILPQRSYDVINTSIFTPLSRTADLRRLGIPLRRGVLLAGPFGTGKTMTANIAAGLAVQNNWTFVYVEDPQELASVIRFVAPYMPAVVFCEDIDRVMSGGRTHEMDALLNVVDGVESKDKELLLVLTTNDVEAINPALLRPGRMDAVIDVQLPDQDAAKRLIRVYGRGRVDPDDNLTESSAMLAGQVPAMIREAVDRAGLAAVARGELAGRITDSDLVVTADSMVLQRRLLTPKPIDQRSDVEKAASIIVGGNTNGGLQAAPYLAQ